jgi:tripartite-type tricarboxylate transporter receptor subunit TctC
MKEMSKKEGACLINCVCRISSRLLCLSLGLFLVMCPWTYLYAATSAYPSRAITIVVPIAPGGMIDASARVFADFLGRKLKQSVVVLNKAGGESTIGGKYVVDAKPDGYTVFK